MANAQPPRADLFRKKLQASTWEDTKPLFAGTGHYPPTKGVVQRHPGPLVLLGNFKMDALRRVAYQDQLRTWGYMAYPTRWTWTWRRAGAHAHERSMTIMTSS